MNNVFLRQIILGVIVFFITVVGLFAILFGIKAIADYQDEKYERISDELIDVQKTLITDAQMKTGVKLKNASNKKSYTKTIEDISKIYKVNVDSNDYYLILKTHKEKFGLTKYKHDYIINYDTGEVFMTRGEWIHGQLMYSVSEIENSVFKEYMRSGTGYDKPPVPAFFKHIDGKWNTGYVITDTYGNEFVWIPLNNEEEQFNKYYRDTNEGTEKNQEYFEIIASINKYQGYYIARYEASLKGATEKSNKGNISEIQSVKNVLPLSNISYKIVDLNDKKYYGINEHGKIVNSDIRLGAFELSQNMAKVYGWNDNGVKTTLAYAEHYDALLRLVESLNILNDRKVDGNNPVTKDSSLWGNYINSQFVYYSEAEQKYIMKKATEGVIIPTGAKTYTDDMKKEINRNNVFNVYDIAGNMGEWTQNTSLGIYNNIRGGSYATDGGKTPVGEYVKQIPSYASTNVGFRPVLIIE